MTLERRINGALRRQLDELERLMARTDGSDYASLLDDLRAAKSLFSRMAADRIAPALTARWASLAQDSLEAKARAAATINEELRSLGLAVRCPKTGLPAALRADSHPHARNGRYSLQLSAAKGNTRTFCSVVPFELQVVEQPPPRSTGWTERSVRKPNKMRSDQTIVRE